MLDVDVGRPPGRVVVGMSGGVDSSVVAALLKAAGFDVIGMTMQIWHRGSADGDTGAGAGCCTIDAVDDARRVARKLNIPYYVPNFRQPFSAVVDDFAQEYKAGRTPNPCVRCNQFVRFGGLLAKANEVEADYIATGHYARVSYSTARGEYVLQKAVDVAKDQSYVLHTLNQDQLSKLMTPLGGLTKSETRKLAAKFDLPVAGKPDSQEICFVAGGNYREFLKKTSAVEDAPGPVVDAGGAVLGSHAGIHGYTIGQRKGLGAGSGSPRFVIELRPEDNAVVVGRREDASGLTLDCEDLHFVGSQTESVFRAGVRVRSHAQEVEGVVEVGTARTRVEFDQPVWGISPGQLAVFYDGDRVIGGGTIVSTPKL